MKKCPFCFEDVQDAAKKCRYCGEWFEKDVVDDTSEENIKAEKITMPSKKFNFGKTFLYSTMVLEILLLILLGFMDMFKDSISEIFLGFLGSLFFSASIGLVITFIIKWIKEGREENNQQNNFNTTDTIKVKKQWNNFIKIFWLLFFMKLISRGAATTQDQDMAVVLFILQIPAILGMVILMGYYSYTFSEKKYSWLFGLLGLFWFAIIGIFLGFFHVQKLKNIKLGIKG